jgi:hypothetical protein
MMDAWMRSRYGLTGNILMMISASLMMTSNRIDSAYASVHATAVRTPDALAQ